MKPNYRQGLLASRDLPACLWWHRGTSCRAITPCPWMPIQLWQSLLSSEQELWHRLAYWRRTNANLHQEKSTCLFLVASRDSLLGHNSSSKDVHPALNSSSGSFSESALGETGVLGLETVLLAFVFLLLFCVLGSVSLGVRLALVMLLPSALVFLSGLELVCRLLLRLELLIMTNDMCHAFPRRFRGLRADSQSSI